MAEFIGIECKQIPKIATGFGGGIGRTGSICGALAGAIMAIGLKYGRNYLKETGKYEMCMRKSLEFYREFEKEHGSVLCRDLTGCDLTTTEGRRKFLEQRIREEKCVKYVRFSMKFLMKLEGIRSKI
ncbi:MAG: C-GCAxxG-C-C family protein [Candidatus Bathyarchaeia archaeon]